MHILGITINYKTIFNVRVKHPPKEWMTFGATCMVQKSIALNLWYISSSHTTFNFYNHFQY